MNRYPSTLLFSLLVALAGCDTDADSPELGFRGYGHGHGHGHGGHGHGHGHGHHGHGCDALDISDLLEGYDAETNAYQDPNLWLAGPDAAEDFVLGVDLDTTIVYPDLSTEVIHPERPKHPKVDIFYIHPTVNLDPSPGQDDLSDLTTTHSFAAESVARFSTLGRVVAPLYRSGTAGCFLAGGQVLDDCLEFAYQDVEDAFAYYLANHWNGQKLVIMGWSQGAVMTRMLMERFVGDHPDLLSRVAVVIPLSGDLENDDLPAVPACEDPDQTGCALTYRMFWAGDPPRSGTLIGDWADADGRCTDITGFAGEDGVFSMAYFQLPQAPGLLPTDGLADIPVAIDTPFMAFPDLYAGGCVDGQGYMELERVDDVDDQRWTPIDYAHPFVVADPPFGLGLHIFDWSLGMGDLLALVEHKAKQLPSRHFHVHK